ncbi:solute carrier family 22 member 7 [Rhipicephalus sanguineus]|uniref:solute carrier family 22 member 7 n=1 Tax=Rhipicephalus sanguineus TaxID=34632 RepID=UPI0018962B50|nr:solute carrier family 22 member 7 [Rhipicephalus sanguineus]
MFIQENVYAILGHGNFQRRLLFTGMLSVVVLLLHAFANFLIGRDVDHWCRPPDDLSHVSREAWRNVAIPIEADGSLSQCTVYHPAMPTPDDAGELRTVIPCYHWDYDTQDVSDSIVSRWDLVCNKRWLYKFTTVANMLGATLLVPAAGFVSDRIGRQLAIMGSVLCLLASSVACSVAQTFLMFLVTRFFVSAASCSVQVLMFILIYEVTGNQNRATYGVLDTALGTTLVPPALHVLSYSGAPLGHGPLGTAAAHVHARFLVLPSRRVPHLASLHGKSTCRGGSRRGSSDYVNLAYYGLVLQNTDTGHIWRTIHMVVQALLYASVCWYISDHGQRETLSILLAFLCASAIVHAAASATMAAPVSSAVALVVESLASAALSVNYGYTAEVFPTTVRSIGLTISYAFGRMGVITASVIVVLWGGPNEADVPLGVVVAALALLSAVSIQWLPEIIARKTEKSGCGSEKERKEAILASLSSAVKPAKHPINTRRRSSGSVTLSLSKTRTTATRPTNCL